MRWMDVQLSATVRHPSYLIEVKRAKLWLCLLSFQTEAGTNCLDYTKEWDVLPPEAPLTNMV